MPIIVLTSLSLLPIRKPYNIMVLKRMCKKTLLKLFRPIFEKAERYCYVNQVFTIMLRQLNGCKQLGNVLLKRIHLFLTVILSDVYFTSNQYFEMKHHFSCSFNLQPFLYHIFRQLLPKFIPFKLCYVIKIQTDSMNFRFSALATQSGCKKCSK